METPPTAPTVQPAVLHVRPKSWFSWDFSVFDGDMLVADVDVATFREAATITIGDQSCRIYREPGWGAFVLEADGEALVRAEKPSALTRRFVLYVGEAAYVLEAASPLTRRFVPYHEGDVLGEITPDGVVTRKAKATLPGTLPLLVRVFVIWLTILLWKRAAAASSG